MNIPRLRPALLLALPCGAVAWCSIASAEITYRFTSTPYNFVQNYTAPCGVGSCVDLVPGERVQGWFTTASPLPPNQSLSVDVGSQIAGWAFTNGTIGLASAPARPDIRALGFKVATDATGKILQSIVAVSRWADGKAGPHVVGDRAEFIEANKHGSGMTLLNSYCYVVATTAAGVADSCISFGITDAANATSRAVYPAGATWVMDAPLVTIGDVSLAEGNAGTATLMFNVSVSRASPTPMSVNWHTVDGTALAGAEYTAASGTLTWAVNDSAPKNVTVLLQGDAAVEPDENFTLQLDGFVGMAVGASVAATGTILNDDAPPPPPEGVKSVPTLSDWALVVLSFGLLAPVVHARRRRVR